MTESNQQNDAEIRQVTAALEPYTHAHPQARVDVQRQNSVSIRIRIIDPDFQGMDRVDREPEVWRALNALPDEVFANITMLLLITPAEAATSLANQEFEDPIPSRI